MKIDIRHVAKLARLRIEEDRIEKFEEEMLSIIDMVENLPPISGAGKDLDPSNPMELRKDIPTPSLKREEVLKNAPVSQSGCLVVPKTVD